jgi:hypothetical protein
MRLRKAMKIDEICYFFNKPIFNVQSITTCYNVYNDIGLHIVACRWERHPLLGNGNHNTSFSRQRRNTPQQRNHGKYVFYAVRAEGI